MQAVHDAKIRRTIELEDARRLLVRVDQHDRAPGIGREPLVDALGLLTRLLLQRLVGREFAARGGGDLE